MRKSGQKYKDVGHPFVDRGVVGGKNKGVLSQNGSGSIRIPLVYEILVEIWKGLPMCGAGVQSCSEMLLRGVAL